MIQTLKSSAPYDAFLRVTERTRKEHFDRIAKNNFAWKQYM